MKTKLFSTVALLVFLLSTPIYAAAQSLSKGGEQGQSPEIEITDNRAVFSFEDLRYDDRNLLSPIDTKAYIFGVPPNWKLTAGGEIEIQYDVFLSGADLSRITSGGNPYGGNLFVKLNDVLIGTIPFNESGSFKARLQVPEEALVPVIEGGRHLLTISLNAQLSCAYDIYAMVTLKSSSFFDLSFEPTSPVLDLARLPSPFYQFNSFVPDSVLVVVPDDPDPLELQSAMDVMSGFGSAIEDVYDINLTTASNLTLDLLSKNHLIFVGMPSAFPLLSDVQFKLTPVNGKFENMPSDAADDGVLQLAVSPWNLNKAIMLVSGNSVTAVLKAAQAVSAGTLITYGDPDLVFVADIQPLAGNLPVVENFSLKSLGYTKETLSSFSSSAEYQFYISRDQVLTREGYVELVYYHSSMSDYEGQLFSVRLNGEVISSINFKEETREVTTVQIKIPPGVLRYGENLFEVVTELVTIPSCDDTGLSDPWLTVSDETNFHIPSATGSDAIPSISKDLKFFPELFTLSSDLGDTAFVLSKTDPVGWAVAGRLAYELGKSITPAMSSLKVVYSDAISEDVLENNSLIVVGRASNSPFLLDINNSLPAPFDPSSDTANERQMQIVYRIPPGVDVGYLELLPSPFNGENTILVVSGNSDKGIEHSVSALLSSDLQSQLAGVFAVTNGVQVATGNNVSGQFSIVGTGVPNAELVVATPLPDLVGLQEGFAPPVWFIPVMIVSGISILVVIIVVIKTVIDKRRLDVIKSAKLDFPPDEKEIEAKED